MDIHAKREQEKEVVSQMIKLYCRKNHQTKQHNVKNHQTKQHDAKGYNTKQNHAENELCAECQELLDYATMRSDHCPFMETKTFCSNCKVHCYKPDMKKRIRQVMRFSGPRMLLYHPLMVMRHMFLSTKEKRRLKHADL